jgi:hypothetical protein
VTVARVEEVASGPRAWWRALVLFLPQVALAPVLFFVGVTLLHEAAHAVVALALGGTVTEFAFLPSGGNLGHVRWVPPPGAPGFYGDLVTVAPYVMWSLFAASAALLAVRRARLGPWLGAAVFFWCYFVPLGDIAWNLYGTHGDLAIGGAEGLVMQTVGTVALLGAYTLGHPIQRRLFGDRSVGALGYVACSIAVGAASGAAAALGLLIFG